jgi:hypothetical protein
MENVMMTMINNINYINTFNIYITYKLILLIKRKRIKIYTAALLYIKDKINETISIQIYNKINS